MRRAIWLQVTDLAGGPSGTMLPQQLVSRLDHGPWLNRDQPCIQTVRMTWAVDALGAPQDDAVRAEGAVAFRARGAKQSDHGNTQCRCKVHGTGVSSDEESSATRESNQFANRAIQLQRNFVARLADRCSELFFPRAVVDRHRHSALRQSARHRAKGFSRPALRAPARAGIQYCEGVAPKLGDELVGPGFMFRIERKGGLDVLQRLACDRRYDGQSLLDYVRSCRVNGSCIPDARWGFARLRRSDSDLCTARNGG